jgi:hypothetical protein
LWVVSCQWEENTNLLTHFRQLSRGRLKSFAQFPCRLLEELTPTHQQRHSGKGLPGHGMNSAANHHAPNRQFRSFRLPHQQLNNEQPATSFIPTDNGSLSPKRCPTIPTRSQALPSFRLGS